jgi:dTDP-4-amino-4,6-dideoxygalactose transaminase
VRYRENLDGTRFAVPTFGERGVSAHHLAPVLAPSADEREDARERLRERRIQTSVHYPPVHRFTHYREFAEPLPVAEDVADRLITLPLHPLLSEGEVDEVCRVRLED